MIDGTNIAKLLTEPSLRAPIALCYSAMRFYELQVAAGTTTQSSLNTLLSSFVRQEQSAAALAGQTHTTWQLRKPYPIIAASEPMK
eukprot:scaffold32204_cov23-Prasinocladus_malaysianus.AAC.1